MTNYTTETYQMKREILNFLNKNTKGAGKPTSKLVQYMLYVISKTKAT